MGHLGEAFNFTYPGCPGPVFGGNMPETKMAQCRHCGPMPAECVDDLFFEGIRFPLCGVCALTATRLAHNAPTYFFKAPEAKRKYRIAKEWKEKRK